MFRIFFRVLCKKKRNEREYRAIEILFFTCILRGEHASRALVEFCDMNKLNAQCE